MSRIVEAQKYYLKRTGKKIVRHHNKHKPSVMVVCLSCGKEFMKAASQKDKYCNRGCYIARNFRQNSEGIIEKRCTKCGAFQSLAEYTKIKIDRNSNGFSSHCKTCKSVAHKQWRKANPVKTKNLRAATYRRNIDAAKRYQKKTRSIRNAAEKARRGNDPSFALKCRIRVLMYASLRHTKNGRKWQKLVGYSIDDLRRHLEKQFKKDMSWDRFLAGEIHIDHIIPISVFNFEKPEDEDFKKCWALKNLQPLWSKDNITKSNKLKKHFQPS